MAQDGWPFRNDGAGSGRLHGDRLGAREPGLPIRYRPMSAGQAETRIFRSRVSVMGMRCTRSVRAATAFGSNRPVAVFERGPAGSGSVFVG